VTLHEHWLSYSREVLPAHAPEVQRAETRRAFYAGAAALFYSLTSRLEPGGEPTDADVEMVEGLRRELVGFVSLMGTEEESRSLVTEGVS